MRGARVIGSGDAEARAVGESTVAACEVTGGREGAAGGAPKPKLPDSGRTGALGAGFLSGGGGGIGGVGFATTKSCCNSGTLAIAVQVARPSVHTSDSPVTS